MPTTPTTAKKPADRKPKAVKAAKPTDAEVVATETAAPAPEALSASVRGRDWSIPIAAVDDFELLDAFANLKETDDVSLVPFILRRMLDTQWREAMDMLRDKETGRVSLEAGMAFTMELMGALDPNS